MSKTKSYEWPLTRFPLTSSSHLAWCYFRFCFILLVWSYISARSLGCLVISFCKLDIIDLLFQYSVFKEQIWLNFYQSLETWKFTFNSLITGKTSYRNSTALLMRLAPISCCSSLACIYMNLPNICSGSASCSSIFYSLAATYSPAPSPVKYHRPLRS